LDSKDLSHILLSSCVFSFINNLYLIFYACVQTFDITRVKICGLKLNRVLLPCNKICLENGSCYFWFTHPPRNVDELLDYGYTCRPEIKISCLRESEWDSLFYFGS